MSRARQWVISFFFVLLGGSLLAFWLWLETTPAELPAPFTNFAPWGPTPLLRRPTPLPLADQPNVTIAGKSYRHPSGIFSVKYPDGWQIDEAEDMVLFTAPDDTAQFSVTFKRPTSASPDLVTLARTYAQNGWGDLEEFKFEAQPLQNGVRFSFVQAQLPDNIKTRLSGQTVMRREAGWVVAQTVVGQAELGQRLGDLFEAVTGSLVLNPPK